MPVCFAPGCKSGYPTDVKKRKLEGKKNVSLFKAPNDENLLELWRNSIPRADKILQSTDHLCELHFPEKDIKRVDELKLHDGSVFRSSRLRPSLIPGSVPILFPNLPKYLSHKVPTKRKMPTREPVLTKTQKIPSVGNATLSSMPSSDAFSSLPSSDTSSSDTFSSSPELELTFDALKENINTINKPLQWTVSLVKDVIMCAKWNDHYIPGCRILIRNNLKGVCYLGIHLQLSRQITSVTDIENLMSDMDKLFVCAGANDRNTQGCEGKVHSKKHVWCENCSKFRKRPECRSRETIIIDKYKSMLQHVKLVNRKNLRLKNKVDKLKLHHEIKMYDSILI